MGVRPPIAVREINPTTPAIAPPSPIFSAQIRRYSAIPQGTATARIQYGPGAAARRRCDELLRFAPRFSPQPTSRPVLFFFVFACPCPCLPPLALGPWSCHVPLPGPSHHARSRSGQRWRSKQASHVGKCNDFVNILISFFLLLLFQERQSEKKGLDPICTPTTITEYVTACLPCPAFHSWYPSSPKPKKKNSSAHACMLVAALYTSKKVKREGDIIECV